MTKKVGSALYALVILAAIIVAFYTITYDNVRPTYDAVGGVLDLCKVDFYAMNKPVLLSGDWDFYYQELILPEDIGSGQAAETVFVPGNWAGNTRPAYGYATYHVLIELGENAPEQLAIKLPPIAHSAKVWIDGKLVLESGAVSADRKEAVPRLKTEIVVFENTGNQVDVVIWASNYSYYKSGVTHYPELGIPNVVLDKVVSRFMLTSLILGGMLFIGLYSITIFIFRTKDKNHLYFGLLCFFYFLRFMLGLVEIDSIFFTKLPEIVKFRGSMVSNFLIVYFSIKLGFLLVFKKVYRFAQYQLYIALAIALSWIILPLAFMNAIYVFVRIVTVVGVLYFEAVMIKNLRELRGTIQMAYVAGFTVYGILCIFEAVGYSGLFFPSLTANLLLISVQSIVLAHDYGEALTWYENTNVMLERTVAERTEDLRKSHDATRELVGNISHDLRTPMTAINGYLELLMANGGIGGSDREYLESASVRVNQMNKLIGDLFLLSRIMEQKMNMVLGPLDIEEFLAVCQNQYQPMTEQKGISLTTQNDAVGCAAAADRDSLMRIMDNLMQNALYYAKSRIRIAAEKTGSGVIISVSDDGPGISEEIVLHIFDRFYKGRKDGTGLGLFIVKELAAAMNGEVSVISSPESVVLESVGESLDYRTVFTLKLPPG